MWGYNQGHYGQCRPVRLPQCTVSPTTCPRTCKPGTSYAPTCNAEKSYRWTCPPKFEARRSCSAPPRKRLTIEVTAPEKRINKQPRRPKSVGLEPTVIKLNVEKRNVSKIQKREVPNKQPSAKPQKVQKIVPPKVDNSKSGTVQVNKTPLQEPKNKTEVVSAAPMQQPENIENAPVGVSDEGEESRDDEEFAMDGVSSHKSESGHGEDEKPEDNVEPQGETASIKNEEKDSLVRDMKYGEEAGSQKSKSNESASITASIKNEEKDSLVRDMKYGEEGGSQKSKSNESASIKGDGQGEFGDNDGTVSIKSGEKGQYYDNARCGMDNASQQSKSTGTASIQSGDRGQYCDNPRCGMDDVSQQSKSTGTASIQSGDREQYCDNPTCGMEDVPQKPRSSGTPSAKNGKKMKYYDNNKKYGMEGVPQKPRGSGTPSIKSGEKVKYDNEKYGMKDVSQKSSGSGSASIRNGEKMKASPEDDVEDHEYLHFLLGITEDILRSNMYTNKGMDEVFQSHLEANRGRLDERRMHEAIEQLKIELNYPLERSTESMCQCDKEEIVEPRADCKCCPGFLTDPQTKAKGSCVCLNPNCPGKKIEIELRNNSDANKREPQERPSLGDEYSSFSSVSQYEGVGCNSGDTQPNFGSLRTHEEEEKDEFHADDQNCVDPVNCSLPSRKSGSDKNKVLFEGGHSPPGEVTTRSIASGKISSTIRMVSSDDKERHSQMYFFQSTGEVCHCSATMRKTALKIQLDEQDENQEYIVVDGPVCMPKTMLEEQTIPVMIENASSMFIDSDLDVNGSRRNSSRSPSLSKVNLFVHKEERDGNVANNHELGMEDFVDSISYEIQGFTRAKADEVDYDMTPERETASELEEQAAKEVVIQTQLKNIGEESSLNQKSTNSKESLDTASETQSILKSEARSGPLVDPHFGVIKHVDTSTGEESRTPSLFVEQIEDDQEYDAVDQGMIDQVPGSHISEDVTTTGDEDAPVSSEPSKSSSGRICGNKRCSSRESFEKSEGELSESETDFSLRTGEELQLHKRARANSNSSEKRKSCCSGGTAKSDKSDGDVGRHRSVDERPSQRHGSDFENKYHYLLQDASTSMTSADFRQAASVDVAPVSMATPFPIPTAPPPPMSDYEEPIHSVLVHGDGDLRKPSLELHEDDYRRPHSLVELQPIRTSIPLPSSSLNSSETDTPSEDKPSMPKVFEYSTRTPTMKTVDSYGPTAPRRSKPFEYAYARKRGSVSGSSDAMSGTLSKRSVEVESLLQPSYTTESKTSSAVLSTANSSENQLQDKSSDQLKMSETSIPKKDLKVRYTPLYEQEPYDHQDIIEKLDEIPEQDYMYNQSDTIKAITDKLQDFRTIDRNDNTRKFQYINPEENFEIRRASLDDDKPDENLRNAPKPKPTCCGLGQKSKRAR